MRAGRFFGPISRKRKSRTAAEGDREIDRRDGRKEIRPIPGDMASRRCDEGGDGDGSGGHMRQDGPIWR